MIFKMDSQLTEMNIIFHYWIFYKSILSKFRYICTLYLYDAIFYRSLK